MEALMFTYPVNPQDDPSQYSNLIGSFWVGPYGGSLLVDDYLEGVHQNAQQLFNDLVELQNTVGRQTCPVFHNQNWYQITLLQSQGKYADTLLYGSGAFWGPQPTNFVIYTFGEPIDSAFGFPVVVDVSKLGYGATALVNPSACLTNGIDFVLNQETKQIIFLQDPFNDKRFTATAVLDVDGNIIDYQISLFFFNAKLDWSYLSQNFGSVLGVNLDSSQQYKDFINGVWSAWASGTSYDNLAQILQAISDCPRVKNTGEVVQVITNDADYLLIITDQNVYRYNPDATPVVSIGQVMNKDDQLVDAVTIYQPNNGQIIPNLNQLVLGAGFLAPTIQGELTWQNQLLPTTVTTVGGYTQITWPLGGNSADVAQFFSLFLQKGITAGKTLAQCLDNRPQPQTSQPTAANLPTQINPLQFLFQNILRYNTIFVRLKVSEFGLNALGTAQALILRRVIPAHTVIIFIFLIDQAEEDVIMNGTGDIDQPGYVENYSIFSV
jgi:hypothetical protein